MEETKHLSNIDMEKRNCSEALNFNEINKVSSDNKLFEVIHRKNVLTIRNVFQAPDDKNVVDQKFIEINCDLKSSIDKEIYNEETTTNFNEVTTEILNENSTVTSEYDDECKRGSVCFACDARAHRGIHIRAYIRRSYETVSTFGLQPVQEVTCYFCHNERKDAVHPDYWNFNGAFYIGKSSDRKPFTSSNSAI
ncbi:hypothetical protein RR46_11041 [Papilio xuthus]|uniref:Uncharacterized protein n=1 Tax=Papilio xuthus TaxID=66420 RepID=A0A194Q3D4_PAPXU|nr:hypothetical protein RR46_11041 [Papilio xuthus]